MPKPRGGLPVGIAFPGTTPKPGQVFEPGCQGQFKADPRQIWKVVAQTLDSAPNRECPEADGRLRGDAKSIRSPGCRQQIHRRDADSGFGFCDGGKLFWSLNEPVISGSEPASERLAILTTPDLDSVIVGCGSPEREDWRPREDLLVVELQ